MGVYKEGKNWKVQVYYKDWQGNRKRKQKRGFRTKGEAKEWERDFLQQQSQGVDIEFGNFLEIYYKDMDVRLRENTMYTKRYIIDLKIKPYFEKKILSEITVADVHRRPKTVLLAFFHDAVTGLYGRIGELELDRDLACNVHILDLFGISIRWTAL